MIGQIPVTLTGFWDETSRVLAFQTSGEDNDFRFYKGILFSTPTDPKPGQDTVWTLVGFRPLHANSRHGDLRWERPS